MTIYVAQCANGFLKVTDERDCIPPDAHTIESFRNVSLVSIDAGDHGLVEIELVQKGANRS